MCLLGFSLSGGKCGQMETEQLQWPRCVSECATVRCLLLTWIYWCETAAENHDWTLVLFISFHTHRQNIFYLNSKACIKMNGWYVCQLCCGWCAEEQKKVSWIQLLFSAQLQTSGGDMSSGVVLSLWGWLCRRFGYRGGLYRDLAAANANRVFQAVHDVPRDVKMTVIVKLLQDSATYEIQRRSTDEDGGKSKWF